MLDKKLAFVDSENIVYSKQDRVLARRPYVSSCGGYCVVPHVIVISQLQLDSLLSLSRKTNDPPPWALTNDSANVP